MSLTSCILIQDKSNSCIYIHENNCHKLSYFHQFSIKLTLRKCFVVYLNVIFCYALVLSNELFHCVILDIKFILDVIQIP